MVCRKGARDWMTSWSHKLNFTDMAVVAFPFIPIQREKKGHTTEKQNLNSREKKKNTFCNR